MRQFHPHLQHSERLHQPCLSCLEEWTWFQEATGSTYLDKVLCLRQLLPWFRSRNSKHQIIWMLCQSSQDLPPPWQRANSSCLILSSNSSKLLTNLSSCPSSTRTLSAMPLHSCKPNLGHKSPLLSRIHSSPSTCSTTPSTTTRGRCPKSFLTAKMATSYNPTF